MTEPEPKPDGTWPLAVIDGRKSRPCLGCGFCCKTALCAIAQRQGATESPCQFLENDGERYWCGLILKASPQEAIALRARLYIGAGCCSTMNSDRASLARREGQK